MRDGHLREMKASSKEKLLAFAGRRRGESFSSDDLQGLLLQISFAIMMIFMMAYFLFRTEAKKEQQEQLLELERQKLVMAVDVVGERYRARYGLDTLMPAGRSEVAFDASAIVTDGKLTDAPIQRGAFMRAAANGTADFSDTLALRRKWLEDVAAQAQVDIGELARVNGEWLARQADTEIEAYETDVKTVQYAGVAELQRYWMRHPREIDDPKVAAILEKFNAADENARLLLATELSTALKTYAFEVLSKAAGAPLLK